MKNINEKKIELFGRKCSPNKKLCIGIKEYNNKKEVVKLTVHRLKVIDILELIKVSELDDVDYQIYPISKETYRRYNKMITEVKYSKYSTGITKYKGRTKGRSKSGIKPAKRIAVYGQKIKIFTGSTGKGKKNIHTFVEDEGVKLIPVIKKYDGKVKDVRPNMNNNNGYPKDDIIITHHLKTDKEGEIIIGKDGRIEETRQISVNVKTK